MAGGSGKEKGGDAAVVFSLFRPPTPHPPPSFSQKTPCGFCFVVFYERADAAAAVAYLNGHALDERPIRCDWDWGFVEGRQFGRGRAGGQVCVWRG